MRDVTTGFPYCQVEREEVLLVESTDQVTLRYSLYFVVANF